MEIFAPVYRFFKNIYDKFIFLFSGELYEDKDDLNCLKLNIKFQNKNHLFTLSRNNTIDEVKGLLAEEFEIPQDKLVIIFSGRELTNDFSLENLQLTQYTTLDIIQLETKEQVKHHQNISETNDDPCVTKTESRFFVYCSDCKEISAGKLRVRCENCKNGGISISKEPECWEDVIHKGRIKGICLTANCQSNEENSAEFYFKCASIKHPMTSTPDSIALPLQQMSSNYNKEVCLSCYGIRPSIITFKCQPSHVLCLQCFKEYLKYKLDTRDLIYESTHGYTMGCPAKCENSLIDEVHHFKILDDYQYNRYKKFAAEEYVRKEGGILCPAPDCGAGLMVDPNNKVIICDSKAGCGFVFCSQCLKSAHTGECFPELFNVDDENFKTTNGFQNLSFEKASRVAIHQTTKPCPKCKTPTEKNGGCSHMTCSSCHYDWCWQCKDVWQTDCELDHWFI